MIEIVDVAYYINRGKLQLKNPIYGPLRASGPMPGDPTGRRDEAVRREPPRVGGDRPDGERHQAGTAVMHGT